MNYELNGIKKLLTASSIVYARVDDHFERILNGNRDGREYGAHKSLADHLSQYLFVKLPKEHMKKVKLEVTEEDYSIIHKLIEEKGHRQDINLLEQIASRSSF